MDTYDLKPLPHPSRTCKTCVYRVDRVCHRLPPTMMQVAEPDPFDHRQPLKMKMVMVSATPPDDFWCGEQYPKVPVH